MNDYRTSQYGVSRYGWLGHVGLALGLIFLFGLPVQGQDLTPSVNLFNFDYGSQAMSPTLDSIIAGRYEVLVADGSYGWTYVSKYNELHAHDSDMEFYVYHNFNDPYYSSAGLPGVNEWVGPRMEADGHDSTNMYWHSEDYTVTDWGHYEAYATSEFGSRLRTYSGSRALVNNTDLNFIHHFTDYAALIAGRHDGRNYDIAGLWFDNMSIPQTVGVGAGTSGRHIYEAALGGPYNQYGAWTVSDWQQAFKDTVLIKYMAVLGDSLQNRLGIKVCINAMAWGYGDKDRYAGGYQPEYFDGSLAAPVHREYEFGLSPHDHNEQLLYPGPSNSASSIVTSVVAEDYSPVVLYNGMVNSSQYDVEHWFSPGHGHLEYPFRTYWYDCLVMYYLIKSRTTFISFANVPESNLGVLNWLDGGASDGHCVAAGNPGDSCYWIDALGVRVGRDGMSTAWDSDQVNWYAASVDCNECLISDGLGKDAGNQNWVAFSRRWTGDDGYEYMVILRTAGTDQTQFAGSHSPYFSLLDGPWEKLHHNGTWDSPISTDQLENGRGGIYRRAAGECLVPSSIPTLSSPANGSEVSTQPTLCVNNSTPASGCLNDQSYQFEVYSDASLTTRVAGPSTVSEGGSTSCFTPSSALAAGQQYWWRARCYNGAVYSSWMGPYTFYTPNTAPPAPSAIYPSDGSQVGVTQPTFLASSVTDPEGSPVEYQFDVSQYANFSSLIASSSTADDTGWTIPTTLSNGVTYHWRCRATDGVDWSPYSDVCAFAVVANTAPDLSGTMTPDAGDSLFDSSPVLTVQNGSDNEGDPLTYEFQLWDAVGASVLASDNGIPEGSGSTSWTIPIGLEVGTYYRWRARCYDGAAYSSWTDLVQFLVVSAEDCEIAPGTPSLSSPSDGSSVGSTQPVLCLVNSTPSPGCSEAQTYVFEVYSDSSLTTEALSPISSSEGSGTTCVTVAPSLQYGRWYYWRARCYNGTSYSDWTDPFRFATPNSAPPSPSPNSPEHDESVGTMRPELGINPVSDPNGTPVTYHFEVSADFQFSEIVASGSSGLETIWTVSAILTDGERYYWHARAYDGIDYSSFSVTWQFSVNTSGNDPPATPLHYLPLNGVTLLDLPIDVIVNNAVDPDGDPVYYDFYLYSDPSLTQLVDSRLNVTEQTLQTEVLFFSSETPINNQVYYWNVRAHDFVNWSTASNPYWFRYFSFVTDTDDQPPEAASPPDGATVATRQPTLRVRNLSDSDDRLYLFDVSTDSGFVQSVVSSPGISQGGDGFTEWQVPDPLPAQRTYYWRCKADDNVYSAAYSFTIDAAVFAYPNPVRFSEGERVTFQLPEQDVELLIQTVSGETVLYKQAVSGLWDWDGRNESGHQVAVGIYLWYVGNSEHSGKIVVKP